MAELPGHKWEIGDVVELSMGRFFEYTCRKCSFTTLNGRPLPAPYNKHCGKEKTK